MSMDDDLFNVPENDEDMNEDEDDFDNDEDQNTQNPVDEEENDDDNDENDDDNDDNEDGEDDEDDDEDDNNDNDNGDEDDDKDDEDDEDDSKTNDEAKFVDASENGPAEDAEDMEVDDAPSELSVRQSLIHKAQVSYNLDIIPSVAIPYASQCQAIACTDGPKWILTGGEDGFIRKYDFIASVQGKSPLTMAQKHNMVDSVSKAGVICSYWENEQPLTKKELLASNSKIKQSDFSSGTVTYEPKLSPVYSMDVERNGLWCLSGVLSGGISLYTMRYSEGTLQHYFQHGQKLGSPTLNSGHNDAISCIKLNQTQDRFLSGSWDKTIREWDLNTGKCTSLFQGSSGQVCLLQFRPQGLGDLNVEFDDEEENSDMGSLFGDSDNENDDNRERETKKEVKSAGKKTLRNESVFMSSSTDGTVNIWDLRATNSPVIKYGVPLKTPPWCVSSTWSNDGDFIYVGRRNSTVDELSLKMPNKRYKKLTYAPNVLKTLQFPKISGPVTALSTMPNDSYLLCGSYDNIRLYNLELYNAEDPSTVSKDNKKTQATPFLIIPGHHGGVLSSLYVDETGRFMVSASGNRGFGNSNYTDSVIVYEMDFESKKVV